MKIKSILVAAAFILLAVGCAHPIKVVPDIGTLDAPSPLSPRVAVNVGYHIPPEARSAEVTTLGGGGDNVRYFPYRDIEAGYQKILSSVFVRVVNLPAISDRQSIARDGIDFIIVPAIVTTSGGAGLFTWPPTSFTVDLTSQIRDTNGKLVASPRVIGTGNADTSERLAEHGIAGRRAMEDALLKMRAALLETNLQSGKASVGAIQTLSTGNSAGDRLAQIKELKDKGLISQEEYEAKRRAILDAL